MLHFDYSFKNPATAGSTERIAKIRRQIEQSIEQGESINQSQMSQEHVIIATHVVERPMKRWWQTATELSGEV